MPRTEVKEEQKGTRRSLSRSRSNGPSQRGRSRSRSNGRTQRGRRTQSKSIERRRAISTGHKVKGLLELEDSRSHNLKLDFTRASREGRPFPAEKPYHPNGFPVKGHSELEDPRSHNLKLEYERKMRESRRK